MAESQFQLKSSEKPLGSQNIPPLIAFPKTKLPISSPNESNHSTNRQPQKNPNPISSSSSPGMRSPAQSVAAKSDRVNQTTNNGNANNLDGSEIRLIEIEGLWIVCSPNIVPYAQLKFMCDLNELNYDIVLEKYWKQIYKTRDLHMQEYMNNFYNDKLQQKQASDRLKSLFKQSGSTIPGVLSCFLHNQEKQANGELQLNLIDALQAKEDDYLPQILHNFSLIQQGNITQAFYSSLNNFMLFGFHTNNSLPPPIPRLNGFQLLLSLFDCVGQAYAQQLNQLLKKDLYFSGEHLFKLVSFYTERKQPSTSRLNYNNTNNDNSSMIQSLNAGEEQAEKVDLLNVLEGMLERIKKMKNNGIRNSVYLYHSFLSFYIKIHNKSTLLDGDNDDESESNAKMQIIGEIQSFNSSQSKQNSAAEKEKLMENTPYAIHFYEEWVNVKTSILRQEPLTKKMEAIWVHAAFKELYYDAVQMLGEKSIIVEENTQIGLKCFGLLSDLGEKNSIHLHYSLLCYHGLYKEAAQLLGESKRSDLSSMQIQCQIRNSEIKQSLDNLRVLCQNRIESYDFYLFTKCVFTQEEKDFFGALCVLVVITQKSQNNFPLFENLLIAKMLMRGTSFLPKNIIQSYVLLKALLKRGKFELMKDYICRLFIKKNLHKVLAVITPEQLKLAKGMFKQLCRKSTESNKLNKKKKTANTLSNPSRVIQTNSQMDEGVVCFSEQFYGQLLQLSVKDIKRSILSKIEMLKSKSELQYVSSQLREYYNELITIGRNVLFMPEKVYSTGNLASNFDYFNAKNRQNINIQSLSLQLTDVQALKQLITQQHTNRIFNLPNIQYKILKYFYAKKTAAIKDFINSSQNSSVQQQQHQQSQEGSFELIQQEQLLHSPFYLKVQKQLEQIEERTEYSLPMSFASQNNLSLQQSQEAGDYKQAREQQSQYQSQQSQNQGYLSQNNNNIPSNNILIQEQNPGEINKTQQKQEDKEQEISNLKEQQQQEGTTLQGEKDQNQQQQQQDNQIKNDNNYTLESDAIINAAEEESLLVSKYFSMQLDSDYSISIEGKLSQDEVLIFSEDDIVSLSGDKQQTQSNQNGYERISMRFNPQQECILVKISSRDITKTLNGELAKVISPFCLKHYGFLIRGEGYWYVLQQPFEDIFGINLELSFAQIYQISKIVNALHLADLTGIFAYYGTDLLFERENNLYLSNIISVSQIVSVEYIDFDKESNSNQLEREYAPELFSGSMNIDRAKSDVWMIGVILFHSIFKKQLVKVSSQQKQPTSNASSQRNIQKELNNEGLKQDKQQGNSAETKQDLYLKEVFKFKEQSHLKMILSAEKVAYYQKHSQNQEKYNDTTEATSNDEKKKSTTTVIPQDIMEIYCKCLEMCLEFDPEMRCTSQELSTFLLQQLKASSRNQDQGDNLERLLEKKDEIILDLEEKQHQQQGQDNNNTQKDNQQQQQQQKQQHQQTEWIYLTGGNTFLWVNMKDQLVFYRDENQNSIILYNPQLSRRKMKQSEVLTGIGVLIKQFKVESSNYNENISIDNSQLNQGQNSYSHEYYLCELKNGKTKNLEIHLDGKNIQLQFDDNGLVDGNTVTQLIEKEVLQQVKAALKQQIESSDIILKPYLSESLALNYLSVYQQLLTCLSSARKINSLQVDLFGREISGISQGVKQQGVPLIMHSPLGRKCLFITENSCLIFEQSTLSLLYFSPFLTHTNEGSQQASIINILSSLFMKEQDYLSLFSLPSLAYLGGYMNNQFYQGLLLFKHANQLTISQHPQRFSPYMTTISYSNSHFFDGHIFQGKYNGYGEYSNKKQMLYKGNFVDNFLSEGTIYFDSHPQYLFYEGEVLYNKQTETYMMHGQGKCVLKNKTVFEGQFEMNQFSGKGKLTDKKKKAIYDGFWKGGLRDGPGVYQSKSNCFEGEYKKGQKSNYGKQVRKQGKEIYEGEFKNNKRNGIGVLRFPVSEGVVYFQGEFLEDKRHGEGIEITKSQQKFQVKYYKDQCIRRKQLNLSSQDYLFHFSNSKLKPLAADAELINEIAENNQEKDYEFIPLEREIQQGSSINQVQESQQKLQQNKNNENQSNQKKQQSGQDQEIQNPTGKNNSNDMHKEGEDDFYSFF